MKTDTHSALYRRIVRSIASRIFFPYGSIILIQCLIFLGRNDWEKSIDISGLQAVDFVQLVLLLFPAAMLLDNIPKLRKIKREFSDRFSQQVVDKISYTLISGLASAYMVLAVTLYFKPPVLVLFFFGSMLVWLVASGAVLGFVPLPEEVTEDTQPRLLDFAKASRQIISRFGAAVVYALVFFLLIKGWSGYQGITDMRLLQNLWMIPAENRSLYALEIIVPLVVALYFTLFSRLSFSHGFETLLYNDQNAWVIFQAITWPICIGGLISIIMLTTIVTSSFFGLVQLPLSLFTLTGFPIFLGYLIALILWGKHLRWTLKLIKNRKDCIPTANGS